jgi:hypothetical protein
MEKIKGQEARNGKTSVGGAGRDNEKNDSSGAPRDTWARESGREGKREIEERERERERGREGERERERERGRWEIEREAAAALICRLKAQLVDMQQVCCCAHRNASACVRP